MSREIPDLRKVLEKLYYDERLTQEEIADVLGCSPTTVARTLRKYGLPTPRDGERYWEYVPEKGARCQWTPEIAYAVGLITTDGSLSSDGRHIVFTSTDYELVETFRRCLDLSNRITLNPMGARSVRQGYRVQFGDIGFYRWLLDIGLMPNKSLRLGPLNVPDEYFADFTRGYLDGDGGISTYIDDYNTFKSEKYIYERLYINFHSGSKTHLLWLQDSLQRLLGTSGGMCRRARAWTLRYAKKDSLKLLPWMYYSPDVPCLERKRAIAEPFLRG